MQKTKKALSLLLAFALMCTALFTMAFAAEPGTETDVIVVERRDLKAADIVFAIDTTGSMTDEINNVIRNLNAFTQILDEGKLNYRIAVIDFKDYTDPEYGEEKTVIRKDAGGQHWFTTSEQVAAILSGMSASGGGDGPEVAMDALGMMLNDLDFNTDSSKFAMVLTDNSYKVSNHYGYRSMAELIADLKEVGVCTSVIAPTSYQSTYSSLYTETDGIFCDINDRNFADQLARLAETIVRIVNPVEITLSKKAGDFSAEDATIEYTLTAKISSMDDELDVNDLDVTLYKPVPMDTATGTDAAEAAETVTENVARLAPGETVTFSWNVTLPVGKDAVDYEWKVYAASDDFKTGVIVMSSDVISVEGLPPAEEEPAASDPATPTDPGTATETDAGTVTHIPHKYQNSLLGYVNRLLDMIGKLIRTIFM